VLEYNLSHDNEGGFLLICTPGKRDAVDNLGNLGTVARYNISRNDLARTFHISAAENTSIRRNAVYIGPESEVQAVLLTDWSGWAKVLEIRENLFFSEGLARYGHQVGRGADGSYEIGPGWGPSREVLFRGNRYIGAHENLPPDRGDPAVTAPIPIAFSDWPGPQFDPKNPGRFETFLQDHKKWMLRLMERQFGRRPSNE
jgi:hypothetical protein